MNNTIFIKIVLSGTGVIFKTRYRPISWIPRSRRPITLKNLKMSKK